MAVDKLVDSSILDACCLAEANAIRSKTGGSSQISYDWANSKGFADAISAISGGNIEIESGTFILTSAGKSKSLSISFQPDHFVVFASNSTFPTDNVWKTLIGFMPEFGEVWYVTQRYGESNLGGASRAAGNHSYSSGTFTFSFNYNMADSVTYYWYAWRDLT